jgi:hypothetical protein
MNKPEMRFNSFAETGADAESPQSRHHWGHGGDDDAHMPQFFMLGLILMCCLWFVFYALFSASDAPEERDALPFVKDGQFEKQSHALTNISR